MGCAVALNRIDQVNQKFRSGTIAEPPAGHGKCLGYAIDEKRSVAKLRRDVQYGSESIPIKHQVLINIVAQHMHQRILSQHLCYVAQVLGLIDTAGGIAR